MTFTGRLGTTLSMGANVVPAYGALPANVVSLTGISMSQVGNMYDFALGYDPGTGQANMVGYMITEKAQWQEGTQLQDVQKLISVASSSTTDRDLTRWPKVSQGDWSTGERQLVFTDTARYYSTDGGIDVSNSGRMTLLPAGISNYTIAVGALGGLNRWPLETDGDQWYLGTPAGTVVIGLRNSTTTTVTVNAGEEIICLLAGIVAGSPGVFAATNVGIWFVDGSSHTVTQWAGNVANTVFNDASPCMAYIDGRLYYVAGTGNTGASAVGGESIMYVAAAGVAPGTTGNTNATADGFVMSLSAQPSGLIWATQGYDEPGTYPLGTAVVWTSAADITGVTRIGTIPGIVKYIATFAGQTYLLAHQTESPATNKYNYTLYSYTTSLTVLDDMRFALPDFQSSIGSVPDWCSGNISGDGRYVYIGWPGLQVVQIDLIDPSRGTGIERVAGLGAPGTTVHAHRAVKTSYHGYVDMVVNTLGGVVTIYNQNATQGTLVTSYYDFNTPGLVKRFRSLEISLLTQLPAGSSLTVNYQADSSTNWLPLTVNEANLTNLIAYFPQPGILAKKLRFQVTLFAGNGGNSPVIQSWAVNATLGRVWQTTASCRRSQSVNNISADDQGLRAQDLLANLQKSYANAGRCILFVPSPTMTNGVEQVTATLQDYVWKAEKPGPKQDEQVALDMEGDVDLTLTEDL